MRMLNAVAFPARAAAGVRTLSEQSDWTILYASLRPHSVATI